MIYQPWKGAPWKPRTWQAEALPIVLGALAEGASPLISAIMGAGKSCLTAELVAAARAERPEEQIVCAVPSQRLVRQLAQTLSARLGEAQIGQYYADRKQSDRPVIVVCYPSLGALADRLDRPPGLLALDEAHRSAARKIGQSVEALRPIRRFGLTATPYRSIPAESLHLFDRIAYRYDLESALRDRVLVPFEAVYWDGRGARDVDAVTARMIERAEGPGLVSAYTIEDADRYAAYLSSRGISAESITGAHRPRIQASKLARLKSGDLRALVHCQLLAEGVDLPWLRWLAIRRKVAARVRFVQELGRVLRVSPGKDRALVLDPHAQLATHRLDHAAALGRALEDIASEGDKRSGSLLEQLDDPIKAPAVALGAIRSVIDLYYDALLEEGWIRPERLYPSGKWQGLRISAGQAKTIERMSWAAKRWSKPDRSIVEAAALSCRALTSGQASDLICLLGAGADRWKRERRGYRPRVQVDREVKSAALLASLRILDQSLDCSALERDPR